MPLLADRVGPGGRCELNMLSEMGPRRMQIWVICWALVPMIAARSSIRK